jgi:hypothetical protein
MLVACNYFFSSYLFNKKKSTLTILIFSVFGLLSTLRTKVIILFPVSCGVIWLLFALEKDRLNTTKLPLKHFLILVFSFLVLSVAVYQVKDKLIFYSTQTNARKAIFLTSLEITKNNYGFGEGFGRYGSAISAKYYSPLYYKYGLNNIWGISIKKSNFITDQWWGWYIGESGFIGMLFFLSALFLISVKLSSISKFHYKKNKDMSVLAYTALGGLIYGVGSGFADGSLSGPPTSYFIMGIPALAINLHYSLVRDI